MWAGQTDPAIDAKVDRVLDNWVGHPNTTITVLTGVGAPFQKEVDGTPVTHGPATRSTLQQAIQDIGIRMKIGGADQFQFIPLDYGSLERVLIDPFALPVGSSSITLPIEDDILRGVEAQGGAEPRLLLAFESNVDVASGGLVVSFELNDCPLGSLADAGPTQQRKPQPHLSNAETVEYSFDVPLDCLVFPIGPVDPAFPIELDQIIDIINATGSPIELDYVALSLGGLFNFVPAPTSAAQAIAALATLFALARCRRPNQR